MRERRNKLHSYACERIVFRSELWRGSLEGSVFVFGNKFQDSVEEEYLLSLLTRTLYLCLACVLWQYGCYRLVVHVVTIVFCLAFCCCRCTVCDGEVWVLVFECYPVVWLFFFFFLISSLVAYWSPAHPAYWLQGCKHDCDLARSPFT